MTLQSEILDDEAYIPIHEHGYIGLIDWMGSDEDIAASARNSYGKGTKSVLEDTALIRYLVRHQHTTPIEMGVLKFDVKCPIFVARQWVRHRMSTTNEYSARYSEMTDEFYLPSFEYLAPQSTNNKQGRAGEISAKDAEGIHYMMNLINQDSYSAYQTLLGKRFEPGDDEQAYMDAYNPEDPLLSNEFPGLARELSRIVLPVSVYTQFHWKIDLHNLFKFLKLRTDKHAQREIRDYADAIERLIEPIFPAAFAAYQDYIKEAVIFSQMEMLMLKQATRAGLSILDWVEQETKLSGSLEKFLESNHLTKREYKEFIERVS